MNSTRCPGHVDTFNPTKTYLITLLNDIHQGKLKVPNFQRRWRSSDDYIVSLLASIGEGYPIGSVTLAQAHGELGFTYRCLDGAKTPENATIFPDDMIVDGQQRLTAVHQACYSDVPVHLDSDQGGQYRLYFFDIRKAISTVNSLEDAIVSLAVDADGRPLRGERDSYTDPSVQFEKGIFPINRIFQFDEWEATYRDYWDNPELAARRSEAIDVIYDFRDGIVNAFSNCMFSVIKLERGIRPDRICRIYENMNSNRIPLDELDGSENARVSNLVMLSASKRTGSS